MGTKILDPFWDRVKRLMKAHKISQKDFSAYINVSLQTFKCWLYYNRIPDAYTSCDIAEALIRKTAAAEIRKMSKIIRKNARLIG